MADIDKKFYQSIIDLICCRNSIIEKVKQEKGELESEHIKKEFYVLDDKFNKALLTSIDEEIAIEQYNGSDRKKVDPFIAGGLANGLFGAGAGVYTAINTANNNASIENNKGHYRNKQEEKHKQFINYERELIDIFYKLQDELHEMIPDFENFFKEEFEKYKKEEERRKKEEEEKVIKRTSNILTKFFGGVGIILSIGGILIISLGEPLGIGAFIFAGLSFLMAFYENKNEKKHSISNFKKEV